MLLTQGSFDLGFSVTIRYGPPGPPLLFVPVGATDTITLSADYYGSIGATWQAVFFEDADTPIEFENFTALWAAVSAVPTINEENGMGTIGKGFALYTEDTDRATLNRALIWFGLDPIYAEFGPTWNDADVWEDTSLWTE